jgi:hypothetical protein
MLTHATPEDGVVFISLRVEPRLIIAQMRQSRIMILGHVASQEQTLLVKVFGRMVSHSHALSPWLKVILYVVFRIIRALS